MYSLFSNENLGMMVEEVRLGGIRQQIEAQRLADEVKTAGSDHAIGLPIRWLDRARAWLMAPDQKHGFTLFVWKLQKNGAECSPIDRGGESAAP